MSFSSSQKKVNDKFKNKSESSSTSKSAPSREIQSTHDISSNQTQQNILDLQQTLENQEIQRIIKSGIIQPKLKISYPNDPYEREADRVADQIMRMVDDMSTDEQELDLSDEQENKDELKISRKSTIQDSSNLEASDETNQINNISTGRPLDNITKSFMESRFNRDFSDVRIHDDYKSQKLAGAVNAKAFTKGNDIFMGQNQFVSDKRLLAHELTHVIQSSLSDNTNNNTWIRRSSPDEDIPNPLDTWELSPQSLLLLHSPDDERLYVIPGNNLVWRPTPESLRQLRSSRGHIATDLGTLFEVPSTGASGTRIFRAGRQTAMILDMGSNPPTGSVPSAVYMNQFQAVMANLGLTRISRAQIIHVHSDHVSETARVISTFNIRAQNVVIPHQYIGVNRDIRQVVDSLQNTSNQALVQLGFGNNWTPGTILRDRGAPGDVFRHSFRIGDLIIEQVALRSALRNVSHNPDLASYLTKVTRRTDQAQVVVLGDLRGQDLNRIRSAMEQQRRGSWNEFFRGVTTISGFSHHMGRMGRGDISGMMNLLDATLLRTGRLRIVEQTNMTSRRSSRTRSDTLELARRLGAEVTIADMPSTSGGSNSAAGATRDSVYRRGTTSSQHGPIQSNLTRGFERLEQLNQARETIRTWRPWLEEVHPRNRQTIQRLLPEIEQSISTLRQSLRTATEAAVRVRTSGNVTSNNSRDYSSSGGTHGSNFSAALRNIPSTTVAETSMRGQTFNELRRLRNMNASEIPLRVALHAAIVRGIYSPQAFRHMLNALDPNTRSEVLHGRRGGMRPQNVAFDRLRSEFHFRRSVTGNLSVGIPRNWSTGARGAGRATGGLLAVFELWNSIIHPLLEARRTHVRTFRGRNLIPFIRRLAFWQQLGVKPKLVGVEDPTIGDPSYERNYDDVVRRLSDENSWNALFIEEPGLDEAQIMVLGASLSYHIRNYDEFATFFIDSGQDAIRWRNQSGRQGWANAEWDIKVGRYETSGSNHVEEYWYHNEQLTQLMQVYVHRIIQNTRHLLAEARTGSTLSEETEDRLGVLQQVSNQRARSRARLRRRANITRVQVDTTGGARVERLDKTVRWWSQPDFLVYNIRGNLAQVGGADYNTYAVLRSLETERRTLNIGGNSGSMWTSTEVTGNESGKAWIPVNLLIIDNNDTQEQTSSSRNHQGPRVRFGTRNATSGTDTNDVPSSPGIRIEFW